VKSLKLLICLLLWTAPAWAFTPVASRAVASDQFNISQSTLGAATPRIIFSDPLREVNHVHVSPDQTKIMFTRYNNCTNCGFVTEASGYFGTETIICNIDGTNCYDMAGPDITKVQCNAECIDNSNVWMVYADSAANNGRGTPLSLNISTGLINYILDGGSGFSFADPQQVGTTVIHTYKSLAVKFEQRDSADQYDYRQRCRPDSSARRPADSDRIRRFRS
jgi:hypothetical protein